MFYIVTAFHTEAKPIIEHFGLKKIPRPCRFQVFAGDNMVLVESGMGIVASAAATSFLLTEFKAGERDVILNVGICGAKEKSLKKGDAVLCHKVINHDTKRAFYPDVIVKHAMKEGVLETFSFPVDKDEYPESHIEGDLVDMEGAGFFEAASFFLPPHKIHCVKVVYDYLDGERVDPVRVLEYIRGNIPLIESLMTCYNALDEQYPMVFDEGEPEIIREISRNLKLSVTMTHQLKDMVRAYVARHKRGPEELKGFLNIKVCSKNEGKVYFERIREMLSH
ncbi:purine or other phosphorylase family 1 [Thermosediminibacter oceani]|uniref:Purine or other phosphorylase family 1 n=1 Tax=Thermosediminibacter oceani (strain ATCC BAA-1034 / DSM 16646 / JW/IW-1228P) TaxID=555079 RepID=D9RYG9_THEOJ|nr:purine or other phosphorylase family 1 [Thermosediminibacter oceani]ADL08393.1 purine or other phosphorylase family 1 [Thermosediminibacter oceani DSM 16646]